MDNNRIIHILFSLNIGGTENMVVDIVNEQSKNNNVTLLIINDHVDERVLSLVSDRVSKITLGRDLKLKSPWFILKVWKYIWQIKPAIVHLHNRMALKLFYSRIHLPKFNLKFTVHTTGIHFGSEILNADIVYSISNAVKNDLEDRLNIVSTVVYNGVPFDNILKRCSWELYPNKIRIVQVGRLAHEIKGQDLTLQAIAHLADALPNTLITIDFIGDGESRPFLEKLASNLNIQSKVRFIGALSKPEIFNVLHEYDLLVQPSRIEGFGLTVVEAMAAQIPVLVSDIQGPMEIINNGNSGYFFESENIEMLTSQIQVVFRDYVEGRIKDLIKQSAGIAKHKFNICETAKLYTQIAL